MKPCLEIMGSLKKGKMELVVEGRVSASVSFFGLDVSSV